MSPMNDFAAVNAVYASYFSRPIRRGPLVQVAKLLRGVKAEIVIASQK